MIDESHQRGAVWDESVETVQCSIAMGNKHMCDENCVDGFANCKQKYVTTHENERVVEPLTLVWQPCGRINRRCGDDFVAMCDEVRSLNAFGYTSFWLSGPVISILEDVSDAIEGVQELPIQGLGDPRVASQNLQHGDLLLQLCDGLADFWGIFMANQIGEE